MKKFWAWVNEMGYGCAFCETLYEDNPGKYKIAPTKQMLIGHKMEYLIEKDKYFRANMFDEESLLTIDGIDDYLNHKIKEIEEIV